MCGRLACMKIGFAMIQRLPSFASASSSVFLYLATVCIKHLYVVLIICYYRLLLVELLEICKEFAPFFGFVCILLHKLIFLVDLLL